MRIQLLSDLHLEVHPQFIPEPAPHADVLVLAGDIGSYQSGSALLGEHFGLERFANWPVPVLFAPGNHEYDAQDFDAAHERLRRSCAQLGLVWLERETVVLGGVRFIGTTLWSDFDALATLPAGKAAGHALAHLLKQREKAFRAADFYLRKTGTTRAGSPFLAEAVRAQALECQAWLRSALAQPFAGPTVVVTHFAPSLRSADPRYGLTPGTAGFCNALDALLPQAQLWLHGHLHAPSDYVASGHTEASAPWNCRVAANPLGYAQKGEQAQFRPQCVLTL
ncbi:metallophosphoesterase [Extensimonas sp. H3M7-6]|uniref:metallophosphoesterase n=1 Tax=Extensimonas soli TaxID=3031322 RepID=UPI0023DB08ED|nr:metallophosphoesterase [Extensimonas sp. H3M7-6]MDF1482203.1 metallophosphoesterase [Extensimonas sp. H3M7-6]